MTVCSYFLQGRCRYGDKCWNEHPRGGRSQSTRGGGGSVNRVWVNPSQRSGGPVVQPSSFSHGGGDWNRGSSGTGRDDRSSNFNFNTQNRFSTLDNTQSGYGRTGGGGGGGGGGGQEGDEADKQLEMIQKDMEAWESSGQWLFSCYSVLKDSITGFVELSPEELRMEYYTSRATGDVQSYVNSVQQLANQWRSRVQELRTMNTNTRTAMIAELSNPSAQASSSGGDFGSLASSGFGSSSASGFGSSSSTGFGASTTTTGFGSSSASTTSGFGSSSASTTSGFGSSSATTTSGFGSSTTSGFGSSSASTTSGFGSSSTGFGSSSSGSGFGSSSSTSGLRVGGFGSSAPGSAAGFSFSASSPGFGSSAPQPAPSQFGSSAPSASNFSFSDPAASKSSASGFSFSSASTAPPGAEGFGSGASVTKSAEDKKSGPDGLYTPQSELTPDELREFTAKRFTLGQIPLRPPPAELLHV